MSVTVEIHNTADVQSRRDLIAMIEHILADRPGEWRVVILGSQASDSWDMQITGPNAFERSYTLEGALGQHQPATVASILAQMLPSKS